LPIFNEMNMKFDPNKHHRRSIRLKGYDYTQPGAYFVTICTYQRQTILGEIVDGEMLLNTCGEIARDEWFKTAQIRSNVQLHQEEFVIMPNHLHGIIWIIEPNVRARRRRAPTHESFGNSVTGSIPTIVRSYKSAVTKRINQLLDSPGAPVWKRNYYEHIVRNEAELTAIQKYIQNNPLKWEFDQDNPVNLQTSKET
jgi:putative transposase